jgi:hypothetical protein
MVSRADDSLQYFSIQTSSATSMGGFLSGRNIKRLQIAGIDGDIVRIAARELKADDKQEKLKKFKEGNYGFFTKSVTVSLGNKVYELNIGSCAARLGLTRKEVFDLAKTGDFEKYIENLRDSEIHQTLQTLTTNESILPKVANFALSKKEQLLEKLNQTVTEIITIPGLDGKNYHLEVNNGAIYFCQRNPEGTFLKVDLTSHLNPSKAPENIANIKKQDANDMLEKIVSNAVAPKFSSDNLNQILEYVETNKDSLLEKARMSPGKIYYVRPSKENNLARGIQVNSDGNVFVHFSKKQQEDRVIGEGSFKKVKFALHLNSGNILAISKIRLPDLSHKRQFEIDMANKEIAFLKKFADEPSIAKIQSQSLRTGKKAEKYEALQPYYNLGDLSNEIKSQTIPIKEKPKLALQMLKACAAIEEAGVIHRDIKPANFFLTLNGSKREILLGDFGLACDSSNSQDKNEFVGTPVYMAPEYVKAYDSSTSKVSKVTTSKLDSWALGLTIYEMFGKDYPFKFNGNVNDLFQQLINLKQKDVDGFDFTGIPDQVAKLIKDLLKVDPKERLSPKEAFDKYSKLLSNS